MPGIFIRLPIYSETLSNVLKQERDVNPVITWLVLSSEARNGRECSNLRVSNIYSKLHRRFSSLSIKNPEHILIIPRTSVLIQPPSRMIVPTAYPSS